MVKIEFSDKEGQMLRQLAGAAWKIGAVRDPEAADYLKSIESKLKKAFPDPAPKPEVKP